MESNPDLLTDNYYNNLKERTVSIELNNAEQNQRLRKTCLGLCSPPRLTTKLQEDYSFAVKISKLSLSDSDEESFDILKRVYKLLVSSNEESNKQGSHWEYIGFQGQNPATDLRATGLLSIVHLIFFLEHKTKYARYTYLFGRSEQGNFPFAVVGINISKLVLDCMREGVLNREFNKRKDVTVVMHLFYQGLWHYLVEILKKSKIPNKVMEFYQIFQAVESEARSSPSKIIENYEIFIVNYENQQDLDSEFDKKIISKPNQTSVEVGMTEITFESDIKITQKNNIETHIKQE